MHLQFFADPAYSSDKGQEITPADDPEDTLPTDPAKEEDKGKTFSRDDVAKMIAAETSKAVEKAQKEWLEEQSKEKKRSEMSPEERQAADLADKEALILRKEIRLDYREKVQEDGLSNRVLELLDYTDSESAEASYDLVKEIFTEMNGDFDQKLADGIREGVEARLKGNSPDFGNESAEMTRGAHMAKERSERQQKAPILPGWQ